MRQGNLRADARLALNPQDVNDLREMMAAITGDEKLVDEKFKQHYRMKAQIVDFFEKRNLHEVRVGVGVGGRAARGGPTRSADIATPTRCCVLPLPLPAAVQVCQLEQTLVTGCDAQGVKASSKEIEKAMRTFMQDDRLT